MNKIKTYLNESPILKGFLPLSFLFFFSYLFLGIPNTYLPLYLSSKGIGTAQIGILLSLATFAGIFGQFVWGNLADKSKSKTTVLRIIIIIITVVAPIFLFINSYFLFIILTIIWYFCIFSVMPLEDAIAFECSSIYGIKYNTIRLIGTFGFSVMSVVAGFVANKSIGIIFILFAIASVLSLFPTYFTPKVSGHRKKGIKFYPLKFFLKKDFIFLLSFSLVINITFGFHQTFFSIYLAKTLNTGTALLGIVTLICTTLEYPFLFFADRFVKKFDIKKALIIFGCLGLIRWVVYGLTSNIPLIIIFSVFQGISVVGINFYISIYISKSAPPEGKATTQMIHSILYSGVARSIGSIIGGFLLPLFGMQTIYSFCAIIVFVLITVFSVVKVNYRKIV